MLYWAVLVSILFAPLTLLAVGAEPCPLPWTCEMLDSPIEKVLNWGVDVLPAPSVTISPAINVKSIEPSQIRAGFLKESDSKPFLGNVIFFEGLGDSMLNHRPLFDKLTNEGFRVIAFDYMGQGGSADSKVFSDNVSGCSS